MQGFPMFVVFDLDGTIALTEHRAHFLERPSKEKDWRSFYAACDRDQPCAPIIRTLKALLAAGHHCEIWSGRSDEVAEKTQVWLAAQALDHVPIRMRATGDHRADTTVKLEWLTEASRKPNLIFEDRASVVAMWREQGIVCCQVAPGDF
jgi:hypothetical protein